MDPTPGYSAVSAADVHDSVDVWRPPSGADALNVRAALALMDWQLAGASEAKAAVEMALMDLKARPRHSRHSLLGGR